MFGQCRCFAFEHGKTGSQTCRRSTAIGMSKTSFHVLPHEFLAPKTALPDCREHNDSRARQSRSAHSQDTDRTSWLQNIGRFTATFPYLRGAISDKVRTQRRPCPQVSSHAQHVPMRALFACSWNRNTVRAVDSPIIIAPTDIASTSRSPWCKSIRSHSMSHRPIRCPMMC